MTGPEAYDREAADVLGRALDAGGDFPGWLSLVLVDVARSRGGPGSLTRARPGSWESSLVDGLVRGAWYDDPLIERDHPEDDDAGEGEGPLIVA